MANTFSLVDVIRPATTQLSIKAVCIFGDIVCVMVFTATIPRSK